MFWCCGKVDVIVPGPPSDTLKVDVAVAAKPILLISRATDVDNQFSIVAVKKSDVVVTEEGLNAAEEEFTNHAIVAFMGIAFFATAAYLLLNPKAAQTFYIEPPHEL